MASRPLASSVGTKLLVGITGLFLFLYLLVHIAGNLVVFAGRETFNKYAGALAGNPVIILIEVVLLGALVAHVVKTVAMTLASRRVSPSATPAWSAWWAGWTARASATVRIRDYHRASLKS